MDVITGFIIGTFLLFAPPKAVAVDPVLVSINQIRVENKLKPLIEASWLKSGALERATYLSKNKIFSHDGYVESIRKTKKVKGGLIGENLARDFKSVDQIIPAWMNSPKHKELILNPKYRFAVVANNESYYVLWFTQTP